MIRLAKKIEIPQKKRVHHNTKVHDYMRLAKHDILGSKIKKVPSFCWEKFKTSWG